MKQFKFTFLVVALMMVLVNVGVTATIFSVAGGGAFPSGWVGTNNITTNAIDMSSYYLLDAGSPNSDWITTGNYDLTGYTSVILNVDVATFGSGGNNPMKIQVSLDGGATWHATTYTTAIPTSSTYITGGPITITQSLTSTTQFRFSNNGASGRGVRVKNLNLTGTAGSTPTISVSPITLTGFSYVEGSGPSTSQPYTLSGSNLTGYPGNITITGSTNYEVSTDNSSFGSSRTVAYSSGTLSNTTIYVRLKAGLTMGTYNSETISNAGGGATTKNVTCSGSVTAATPTITVTPTTLTGFTYLTGSGPSAEQNFTVSGSYLTTNISIVPTTNYEISTGTGVFFVASNPITLTQSGGTVGNTLIYVRLKAGLIVGNYNSETITSSSTGATDKTVTCSGSVTTPSYISLNSLNTEYTEIFDIGVNAIATLPTTGWKVDKNTSVRTLGTYSSAVTLTERRDGNNMTSSASNGIYNYGAGDPTIVTDRSIGWLSSSSATKSGNLYAYLKNNTGSAVNTFTISYDVEKYRNGSNAAGYSIQMYYSTDGATWTSAGTDFLTSFTADADNNGFATAPGLTVNNSGKTLSVSVASGDFIYLSWNYSVTSGTTTSNAQALGIDNFSITALNIPSIVTSGTLTPFSTTVGTPSVSQTYTVSATNLTANLIITPPTGFEVREDGIGSFNNSLTFIPVSGTVSTKTVEVQFNPGSVGTFTGDISNASTDATTRNVSVTGAANATFYNVAGNDLNDVNNWGTKPNGAGTKPLNFTSDNQTFIIKNGLTATIVADWIVSGSSSKVVLGDGTNALNFTIPSTAALNGTIDLSANSTITIQNSTLPTWGTLNSASTIDFAQTGTFSVPSITYSNLKLTNGTKVFQNNTSTVINGNLIFDNVTLDAGNALPFTTLTLSGDLTYLGTVISPIDGNSITLICNNNGTQSITGNGNTIRFFRITTTGTNTNVVLSTTGGSTNLLLANLSGGGLSLGTGTNLTVNSNTVEFLTGGKGVFVGTGTLSCDGTSNLILNTVITTSNSTFYFANGANSLNNLTINSGTKNFVLGSSLSVLGTLTLSNGILDITGTTLTIGTNSSNIGSVIRTNGVIVTGATGLLTRYVQTAPTSYLFPIGKADGYSAAVVTFAGADLSFPLNDGRLSARFITNTTSTNTSTLTDGSYVLDSYGPYGFWEITPTNITSFERYNLDLETIGFSGISKPAEIRIIKRVDVSSLWDILGTHEAGTTTTAKRTGYTSFSQFALAGNVADGNPLGNGGLPVNLASLSSIVTGNNNIKLNWTTTSEINNNGFDIERKTVDGNFTKVGFIQGHGTVSTPTNYSFDDRYLQTGKYKYRLKQIDVNGNFEYFALNGEVEIGVPKTFNLSQNYPNPFNPVTKINFDLPTDGKVTMMVYDITGREIARLLNSEYKKAGYYTTDFNAGMLSSGVYFYSLSADNFRMTKKMVVLK